MSPEWINTIGLALNIAGVVLAFFYGYPQPSHEQGLGIGLEDGNILPDGRTVAEHDADKARQKQRYLLMSRTGLTLMFCGFVLQLLATWAPKLF